MECGTRCPTPETRWLYGVGAFDPRPLGGAGLVLLGVALVGAWLPARRALRIDPVTALRAE